MNKKKVIFVTDGDDVARQVIELVAKKIGGRCISRSAGNPTPLSGHEIIEMIKKTPNDPVIVMFDDNGHEYKGEGERAMEIIANNREINVIGAIAVASNTKFVDGTSIDLAVDRDGRIIKDGVSKEGNSIGGPLKVYGDTVDILDQLNIPFIVGIGDIGKMGGRDHIKHGSPITLKAIKTILEWGDVHNEKGNENEKTKKNE